MLEYLYRSINVYFEKHSIEDHTVEDQFLFIQYIISSISNLCLPISAHFLDIINQTFSRLITYPSLDLHVQFLYGQFLSKVVNFSEDRASFSFFSITRIKFFLINVIRSLSNQTYVLKFKEEQTILLYEDLKQKHISMITEDLINNIFLGLQTGYINRVKSESTEFSETEEYKAYKKIMFLILYSFNESPHLDVQRADRFISLFEPYSRNETEIPISDNNSEILIDFTSPSYLSKRPLFLQCIQFKKLWVWFTRLYQHKFIYGDLNSRFSDLSFIHKYQ
ncbi:hypothetical protein RF11_05104 [Thelohanellus kitauei]|uniref:Uncharacterized protein n=1 Tax=Thelohanellus kitauei TaxID=669202 RepID=A0A0C2J475_THEKT|nr:hypothetical protein RF11_05104 [Thelohanellus kitauei]